MTTDQITHWRQVKKLKRWNMVLWFGFVIASSSNAVLWAGHRTLRDNHITNLQVMNRAYQNLRMDYEDVSEHATYLLEKLRAQTQTPGNDVRSRASGR